MCWGNYVQHIVKDFIQKVLFMKSENDHKKFTIFESFVIVGSFDCDCIPHIHIRYMASYQKSKDNVKVLWKVLWNLIHKGLF